MTKHWKDPDDQVVHIIRSLGQRTDKMYPQQVGVLHQLGIDEIAKQFSRIVTLRCERRIHVDNDDFIVPGGEAVLQVPSPILRPWLITYEAPTCIVCISKTQEQNDEGFKN